MESSKDKNAKVKFTEEELEAFLLNMLKDSRKDFTIFSIRELKHYHSPKVVETLADIIQNDSDSLKKIEAIRSLKRRKPNKYCKDIIFEQLKSKDEGVRLAAVDYLRICGDTITNDLHQLLKENNVPDVRSSILSLLGHVGTPKTLEFLKETSFSNLSISFKSLFFTSVNPEL